MKLMAQSVVIKSAVLTSEDGTLIEVNGPFLYTPGFVRKPRKTRTPKEVVEKLPITEPPKSLKGRKSPNFETKKLSQLFGMAKYLAKDGTTFPVGIADYIQNADGTERFVLFFMAKKNEFAYHPEGGFVANTEKMTEIRMFSSEHIKMLRELQG